MAADAALISSFGRLASASKTDYRSQLRAQAEQSKIMTEGITKVGSAIAKGIQDIEIANKKLNEENKLNNQKRSANLNKEITKTAEALNAGGGLQEDVGDAFRNGLKEVEKNYKSYNPAGGEKQSVEDKDKQLKEFNNVAALEQEIVKARTLFGTDIKTSEAMGKNATDIYSMCLNSNDHDNVKSSIVNGKLQYEITTPGFIDPISQKEITPASTKTYSLDDLEELFVPEATETEAFILNSGSDFRDRGGKERYGEVTPEMLQSEADKIANELEKDPKILADISQRRLGGRSTTKSAKNDTGKWTVGSVAYSLQDNPSLDMAVYQTAGVDVDGADGSKPDGVVSQAEAEAVMDGPNRDIVISTIVDPNYINPITGQKSYNHAVSCAIVGRHIAEEHAQYYNAGQKAKFKQEQGYKNKPQEVVEDFPAPPPEKEEETPKTAKEMIELYSKKDDTKKSDIKDGTINPETGKKWTREEAIENMKKRKL